MAEEQALAVAEGDGETQVLDIDPAQLAALLAQSADGTAQLIDEHGNAITLTVEQLAEAGIDLQSLGGAQVYQLGENQQYIEGEDGQYYIIEGDVPEGAVIDASNVTTIDGVAVSTADAYQNIDTEELLRKAQIDGQQQPQQQMSAEEPSTTAARQQNAAVEPKPKHLQMSPPIMSAPKPTPTAATTDIQSSHGVQSPQPDLQQQSRRFEHDQHLVIRREPEPMPKLQYSRRPINEQSPQQHVLMNSSSVNNIPADRFEQQQTVKRQVYATSAVAKSPSPHRQRAAMNNVDMEAAYILQGDELQLIQQQQQAQEQLQSQHFMGRARPQQQQQQTLLRRGNFQAGLLPFQCDQCPRRFAHDHHLKRHQEMAHAKKRPFYCRYCCRDLYLASDLHFQGHLRMQHKQEMEYDFGSGYANQRPGQQTGAQQQRPLASRPPGSSPTQMGNTTATAEENEEDEPDWDSLDLEKQREQQLAQEERQQEPEEIGEEAASANAAGEIQERPAAPESEKQKTGAKPATMYGCNICQKKFRKQEWLDKHKILHTDQLPFSCQYCPRRFKWKENLIKHISWHMDRMPFKCSLCPKGFPTQMRLDVHCKAKHMPKQREHVCPICQKGFYEKEYLAKHMRIHGSKIFPCTECDKKFIDEKFLRRHMMSHTQTRDFTCDICGKVFNKAIHLKSHRTVHTGERPYKCQTCHLAFGFKHNLRAHEKAEHASDATQRPHVCELCGRTFAQKNNYEVHLRVHRGMKPFQCSSCLKQFSRMEHLRTHVNAHAGIRDHQCTICEKYFATKSNLRQHSFVHQAENERAFICGSCPKKFKHRQQLAKHIKMHTKNSDVQYVVIWEKGGSLLEATIISEGGMQDRVTEDALTADESAADGQEKMDTSTTMGLMNANSGGGQVSVSSAQQQTLHVSELDAAQLLAAGAEVLDASQLQLVDEDGNPIQGLGTDQLLILQDGTITTAAMDGRSVVSAGGDGTTVLDPSALLALAEAQGEDGTLYISEENLQALAQQGVVFSFEEASQ